MTQKILIIDDDEYMRELYGEVFKQAGYDVDIAIDGKDGLDKISKSPYNLIILDIMMPEMDGLMLLRKLQTSMPKCPIVLLTNLDHEPVRQEGLTLGANAYLIKADYTPRSLLEKVKVFLVSQTN